MAADATNRRELIIELQQIQLNDAASIFGYPQTNISNKKIAGVKIFPSDCYRITNWIKPAK